MLRVVIHQAGPAGQVRPGNTGHPFMGKPGSSIPVAVGYIAPEATGKVALSPLPCISMRPLLPVTVMRPQDRHDLGSGCDTVGDLEIGRACKLEARAQH